MAALDCQRQRLSVCCCGIYRCTSLQGSKGLGDELGSEVLSVGSVANLSDVYSIIFLKFFLAPDSLICTTDLCKRFMARCAFFPCALGLHRKVTETETHESSKLTTESGNAEIWAERGKKYIVYTKELVVCV